MQPAMVALIRFSTEELMARDPVCDMQVNENETKFHSEHSGKKYFFCSEECKDTFDNKPDQFARDAA